MTDSSTGPLAGIRIVDMADEKAELCGRILADLGADVIRVEPPEGSVSRRLPPIAPDGHTSLYFTYRNSNKRGITLDVSKAPGQELLHLLLADADVWIESFPPGHLKSIGLDPTQVLKRHPQLIITSISDFGQTGPYRDFVGTDMIGFAMGGMMYRAGVPERPPVVAPGALAYDATGVTAGFAVLMAYYQRLQSGRGQHIDLSVMESIANMSDWALPSYSQTGGFQQRAGSGFVYPVYPCKDGHVRLVVLSPREWRDLRAWLGEPDAVQDDVWDQLMFRAVNRDVLDPLIIKLFRNKTKMELAKEAQARRLALTPSLMPEEVMTNAHARSRGTFVKTEVTPGVEGMVPAGFVELDGERHGYRTPAPSLGEHNAEVYVGELGLQQDELATLRAEGIV